MDNEVMLAESGKGVLFTLKDVDWTPETPTMNEPFTVKGKVDLFGLQYLAPVWVIVYVTYPETWWEEIIPIIGAPKVSEGSLAIGGKFEIPFASGFKREGEFALRVEVHAGPTMPIDSFTIPPFPPLAKIDTTFTVSGAAPPEAELIEGFTVISYAKNGGTPVTPPGVLELAVGDKCRVKVGGSHKGAAIGGTLHVALWKPGPVWNQIDEVGAVDKANNIPASTELVPFENTVDIPITTKFSAGAEYGIYGVIRGITGADVYTDYYENLIKIAGGVAPGQGAITRTYINKGSQTYLDLPTTVIADSQTFEVGVTYKNTSTVTFAAGPEVKVYDPSGTLRASPAVDYASMVAGKELRTEYNICAVDKAGSWTIKVRFVTQDGVELDSESYTMTATAVSAQYKGSITAMWINKGSETYIPFGYGIDLHVVADNKDAFEVGVKCQNLSGISVFCGAEVIVKSPDGATRMTPAIDWAGISSNGYYTPNQMQGPKVDVAGVWYIDIALWMNKDSPSKSGGKIVTRYTGQLFVATAVSAQYKGSITSVYISKIPEGSNIVLPTTVVADGEGLEVGAKAKNTSTVTYTANVEIKVYDPGNILRFTSGINWAGIDPDEELPWGKYNVCPVDKAGSWIVKTRFIEKTTSTVLDEDQAEMVATAVTPPPPTEGGFSNLVIERGVSEYYAIVSRGNTCRVNMLFDYVGPKVTGAVLRAALWVWSWFDAHNEAAYATIFMEVPATPTKATYSVYLDIPTRSGMDLRKYGLYCVIKAIAGADIYSPYYPDAVLLIA